jgi:hypothetical protein
MAQMPSFARIAAYAELNAISPGNAASMSRGA